MKKGDKFGTYPLWVLLWKYEQGMCSIYPNCNTPVTFS
ncbi:hypothetical protein C8P68_11063 [Mucilaginibacter yixingensis]|uniref:Uncharacterized protein n=1 Tax=Mucilaginibacter yixingensis TaxID=1295612 RepID=A0A2T5J530_9SPHI|nr:hypothetical protein C8P68_11063 [Mucilaginibacter yixingensis]